MNITAGELKGRKLFTPKDRSVRPTGARVREALFSIIGDAVTDALVLDLFSGAGTIGIEALSRGADRCTFVDKSEKALEVLKRNIRELGIRERTSIIPLDAAKAIKMVKRNGEKFDIVFLDPPYRQFNQTQELILSISSEDIVNQSGILIWEHDSKRSPEDLYGSLKRENTKRYGDTSISFFSKQVR
ncbi:MAG: 16S rRNA (guanine(966)-N(2))-methyltransferase RsmD [Deltaproteobacteria bacterium]|uniref:16S rRNA (Guanine(966)-N(2))-methyltransferase RsmD n=1 Tax=Candidatus Zymogenus saltonus TaxID=2844893 RepID=A0A9D8KEX8_9DELT|nr:16S rRNA (guanine(966)-N(2))-methyltransferase RsmD [Candidatus Zymogenus saltonus]